MLEISTRRVSGGEYTCANRLSVLHVRANHKTRRLDLCRLFRHPRPCFGHCGGDGERCDARPQGSGGVQIATAPVSAFPVGPDGYVKALKTGGSNEASACARRRAVVVIDLRES